MEQGSPRTRIKALLKGEQCGSPLLMPIVFSLGSRLENVPLREFLGNPTKIANALRQIRATLKVDGICCYFDPLLEIEALGAQLDWTAEAARLVSPGFSARAADDSAENIVSQGRVPVVIEVLKRAKLMLRDEPALMVRVTGPLTLASQLTGGDKHEAPNPRIVERCAGIASALVRSYLDAGADVIFLVENSLPAQVSDFCDLWAGLLDPIINVTKFYEALPVLVLDDPYVTAETLSLITGRSWDCALCPSVSAARLLPADHWTSSSSAIGMVLDTGSAMQSLEGDVWARCHDQWQEAKTILLTTTEDISSAVNLKQLAAGLQRLRGALARSG